jgi:hypothetical protein
MGASVAQGHGEPDDRDHQIADHNDIGQAQHD